LACATWCPARVSSRRRARAMSGSSSTTRSLLTPSTSVRRAGPDGQRERHRRPGALGAGELDRAAVQRGDGPAEREPEAGTGWAGTPGVGPPEERAEHQRQLTRRDADAGVAD